MAVFIGTILFFLILLGYKLLSETAFVAVVILVSLGFIWLTVCAIDRR